MTYTPVWNSWRSMKQRCNGTLGLAGDVYKDVSYCDEWEKFENFYADMGDRPEGTTLDRIDTHGDYEPSNCRWATPKQQCRNRTVNKLTDSDAAYIRFMRGVVPQRVLAERYGVSRPLVSLIQGGKSWAKEVSGDR